MKILREFCIILALYFIGQGLQKLFHLPIPGNVIGMLLLLFCLCTNIIKIEMIESVSNFLLDHLAFFFIPSGVALMVSLDTLKDTWIGLVSVLFISTILVLIVTGKTVQFFKGDQ